MLPLAGLLIAYLAGSIPFAYLAGKLFRGIDLREHGSGNLGATNVFRVLGWKIASVVMLLDMAKGALPVLLLPPRLAPVHTRALGDRVRRRGDRRPRAIGLPALEGRRQGSGDGGRRVPRARADPVADLDRRVGVVLYLSGYVSLASLASAVALTIAVVVDEGRDARRRHRLRGRSRCFVFWTHRANIGRLRRGEENRFRAREGRRSPMTLRGRSVPERGERRSPICSPATGTTSRCGRASPRSSTSVNASHENAMFLAGATLHDGVVAHGGARDRVPRRGARALRRTVARAARRRAHRARRRSARSATIVVATKGIERETLAIMSDVLAEQLPATPSSRCRARASRRKSSRGSRPRSSPRRRCSRGSERCSARCQANEFRVYTHDDVIGVELGGALKNVMAVATGIAEGLGLGFNSRAALITRGLAEMTRLGVEMGATPLTFAGLAGMGDLVLTCTGALSRNRSLGVEIARGASLDEALAAGRRWRRE